MSHMSWNYDDDAGERNFDVEIEYEFEPGGWEYPYPREHHIRYWVPGQVEVYSVRVECVEFYGPDGETIGKIKREDMGDVAIRNLDLEALYYIQEEVDSGGSILDDLAENAG